MSIVVDCPFADCPAPLAFGPSDIVASAPRPDPDDPNRSVVELRPDRKAIRAAARRHLADHHRDLDLGTALDDTPDPDVSADAARWTPPEGGDG